MVKFAFKSTGPAPIIRQPKIWIPFPPLLPPILTNTKKGKYIYFLHNNNYCKGSNIIYFFENFLKSNFTKLTIRNNKVYKKSKYCYFYTGTGDYWVKMEKRKKINPTMQLYMDFFSLFSLPYRISLVDVKGSTAP
jgi:hypothetical protein